MGLSSEITIPGKPRDFVQRVERDVENRMRPGYTGQPLRISALGNKNIMESDLERGMAMGFRDMWQQSG